MSDRKIVAHCPECGTFVDAAEEVEGSNVQPEDGDFAVCIKCGSFGVYVDLDDGNLGMRAPDEGEKVELSQMDLVLKVQRKIRRMTPGAVG